MDTRSLYQIDTAISDVLDLYDNPPPEFSGTPAEWNEKLLTESAILTNMRDEEVRNLLEQAVMHLRNNQAEFEKFKAEKAFFDGKRAIHAMAMERARSFIRSTMRRNDLKKVQTGKFTLGLSDKTEYEYDSSVLPDKYFKREINKEMVLADYKAGILTEGVKKSILPAETLRIS